MTSEIRAYLNTTDATIATCNAHRTAWQSFPGFATAFPRLLQLRQDANTAMVTQGTSTKSATNNKRALRESLSARLVQLSNCLVFYFTKLAPNPDVVASVTYTKSTLQQMDGPAFIGTANELLTLTPGAGTTPPAPPQPLAGIGITPEFLTAVTVRVSDAATGSPLIGVRARFAQDGVEEKTIGPEGEFYIETIAEGEYQMELSLPGYTGKTVPVAIVEGEHQEVTETLAPE